MRITLASFVVVFGFAVAPIAAQESSPNPGLDTSVFEHLGLTSDQRVKIRAVRDQVQQENAPLRAQLMEILGGRRFRDLAPAEREALKPQFEPIRKQMKENRRKGRDQINAILTPDQRKQLEHAINEQRGQHREQ